MYHSFFIHSSINEHIGCFHVLDIMNTAAMNTGVHVCFFSIMIFSGYMPNSGTVLSYGSFISRVLSNLHTVFLMAVSIYISTNSARAFPFLHTSPAFIVCRLFDDGHSDKCGMILHCGFDLHFSNNERC